MRLNGTIDRDVEKEPVGPEESAGGSKDETVI